MLGLTPTTRVFLKTGVTDGRLGADALKGLVTQVIREDPHNRQHLFCFCNKARNRLRLLWHDGGGFWVAGKSLPRGTYDFPQDAAGVAQLNMAQLEVLMKACNSHPPTVAIDVKSLSYKNNSLNRVERGVLDSTLP